MRGTVFAGEASLYSVLPRALAPAVAGLLLLGGGFAAAESGTPAQRIASLAPSATEILYAIGAADLVVGVSRQCDFPIGAKLKPKVGDFNRPDLGALAQAAPDVVLFTEYIQPADLEALEEAGLRPLVLPARRLGNVVEAILALGEIAGRQVAAHELAEGVRAEIEEVRARVGELSTEERPAVYIEVDGPHRLYAVGPGSFMDEVIRTAGGRNAFAAVDAAYFEVSSADVILANPAVVLIDHPFQYSVGVSRRAGWDSIRAVQEGRVYDGEDFDIILLNRPGPRIAQSLREVSRLLHPEKLGAAR
ncbi:MAG: helical backbone metal receptor [Deferrisomatales bacterium]|nr:helical backbone metal receptor [Deferrisomatales bacterium]